MIDISEARKRAEAALERADKAAAGPWKFDKQEPSIWSESLDTDFKIYNEGGHNELDAEFIAAARSDVPQLAQDLLQALEEIEQLRMTNKTLSDYDALSGNRDDN